MAAESIISLKRPGFPKESFDDAAYTTVIEYVGDDSTLRAASPAKSTAWGDYQGLVESSNIEKFPNSTYSILVVVMSRKFDTSGATAGTKIENETSYEIDWADVQRSMYEHPEFSIDGNGLYKLTSEDISAIESWKKNPDVTYKKDYIYRADGDYSNGVSSLDPELSANAKMFAKGIQLGIEYWVFKAPVAIQTDTYVNGPPPAGTAGLKDTPANFPNLPEGYEWIKETQSGIRAGGQTSWADTQKWLGTNKVLVDAKNIFWEAP
jgi:hypothetical protein